MEKTRLHKSPLSHLLKPSIQIPIKRKKPTLMAGFGCIQYHSRDPFIKYTRSQELSLNITFIAEFLSDPDCNTLRKLSFVIRQVSFVDPPFWYSSKNRQK